MEARQCQCATGFWHAMLQELAHSYAEIDWQRNDESFRLAFFLAKLNSLSGITIGHLL
jgi:hypothetical protein